MFFAVFELASISETVFHHCFDSSSVGLVSRSVTLEVNFIIANIVHFEFILILQKSHDELLSPEFLLIFLILKDRFSLGDFCLFFACQSEDFIIDERSIFIDQSK